MWDGIVTMEESAPGTGLRTVRLRFFVEIGEDLFDKEITIEYFFW
jgi:hypothetical protein